MKEYVTDFEEKEEKIERLYFETYMSQWLILDMCFSGVIKQSQL